MSQRFKKTIDPKILADDNKTPELQAAEQQIQAMGAEMENMHQMIQNVGKSIEVQDMQRKDFEAQVKAFDAETKRLTAVQASMSPEQIQDIVLGTVHGMITSGDLMAEMPSQDLDVGMEMPPEQMMQQPMEPQQ
jgi:membrane-associated HD superfamily phosphohydrolase